MPAPRNQLQFGGSKTDIWVISEGRSSQLDLSEIDGEKIDGSAREYQISEIGCYLLNPQPIEIEKRLIGCEIHAPQRTTTKIIEKLKRLLPRRLRGVWNSHMIPPEVLVSHCKIWIPPLKDKTFQSHLFHLYESLRAYDPVSRRLSQLDPHKIAHVIGICKDLGGNLTYLKLQGSIEEKLRYMQNYISKNVGVLLRRAYIGDGLFEMRAFDFSMYRPDHSHRLILFERKGKPQCCVFSSDNKVEFRLDNDDLLKYLFLLQQALADDGKLISAFENCIRNQAKPIKLFFNQKLEVNYAKSPFPKIYRDILSANKIDPNQSNLIRPALNYMQIGISFNYIPQYNGFEENMTTLISVLHDLRALEMLRKKLPQVHNEIENRVKGSEAGMYYLLDSIEGFNHEE
ncbi:MAG: hypothetical protein KJP06_10115 [Deltaproteobacteria bacterium]|nr:hypothetical protein [Deltaproteobacteria bacterium]